MTTRAALQPDSTGRAQSLRTIPLPDLPSGRELPRSDLPAEIARQILEHIRAHDLRPGDRLPSMHELANRFSVANPTVREALRQLQATGAVELRQGSGTYVGNARQLLVMANPNVTSLELTDLLEILDARIAVEPVLAARAAERADAADIAHLDDLLRETERHLFPNDSTTSLVNNTFHLAIARIARETLLAQVDRALLQLYGSGYCAGFAPARGRSKDHLDHIAIFGAIRAADGALAESRMRQHLLDSRSDVEACRGFDAASR